MADPTLRLTFDDFRLRVAEYLGIADYSASAAFVPSDFHDLDLVTRLVNDGYRRFVSENAGKWHFLEAALPITFGTGKVAADPARYYLPDDFYGVLVSPFTYGSADGQSVPIRDVPESVIREYNAGQSGTTGTPVVCSILPLPVTPASSGQRWEVRFWPAPTGTQTVTATYKRFPNALANGTDVTICGFQHDDAVLAAAMAEAERQRNDTIGTKEQAYQMALVRSRMLDARSRPSHLGGYGDRSQDGLLVKRYALSTYNGSPL